MLVLLLVILATGALNSDRRCDGPLASRCAWNGRRASWRIARSPTGLDQRALAELAARVGAAEQAMGRLADIESRLARAEQGARPRRLKADESAAR